MLARIGMEDEMTAMDAPSGRFVRAIAAIDAANAADPNLVPTPDGPRPKELAHAELLSAWVRRLRPDASESLLLAARAHHIRRWLVPRSSAPAGRAGYLGWRRGLHDFHAQQLAPLLAEAGYDEPTIARVQAIVRKEHLARDPEVQALEDALCLVFLDQQLDALTDHVADEEKMLVILRQSWRKMSPAGREHALSLDLTPAGLALVQRALA